MVFFLGTWFVYFVFYDTSLCQAYEQKFTSTLIYCCSVLFFTLDFNIIQSAPLLNTIDFIMVIFYTFCTILFFNVLGMIPFGFALTSFLSITLFFSTSLFLGINTLGALINRNLLVRILFPGGSPIFTFILLPKVEFISYLARNLSMAVRLSANMLSGHILTKIIGTFILDCFDEKNYNSATAGALSFLLLGCLYIEVLITFLQAHVFTMMASLYFGDVSPAH
jgi:ATP synthase subunit 6